MVVKRDDYIGGKWFQFAAAFVANIFGITEGIAIGWTSPAIPYFLSDKAHIVMTRNETEWLQTSLLLGACCALPLTAYCTNKMGRKRSILFACVVLSLSWVATGVGNHFAYIVAARFIQGIGLNMAFVAAPMYVGEIAHKSIRGFLSSFITVMSMLGIIVVYIVGSFFSYYLPSIISVSILLFQIIVFSFLPESPHFYITKGRYEEATASLSKFRGGLDVTEEINEGIKAVECFKIQNHSETSKKYLYEIFKTENYRKAIMIMSLLNSGQLLCSFDLVLMNLHEILASAGSVYIESSYAAIIFSGINLLASIACSISVDKFGRKKLLLISVSLTGVCLFLLALYFHLQYLGYNTTSYSWVPVATVMTYAAVFRVGLGMVPIVITSEVFAPRIKSFGMTFVDGVYIVSSVLVLQIFFLMRSSIGLFAPFYMFFGCSILLFVAIVYIVPETKGKSLEEIQEILKN